ncbi:MAG: bifunctional fucokinase/L-fucose-1-P-guanylyltransferase [Prevotella sp.]|nr:bifunctional fucokinase/L-fucose-1-P-guanylyltransferase [Prevotella sp.]
MQQRAFLSPLTPYPSPLKGVGAFLLSLPPNLVDCFHEITGLPRERWFCTNDPVGHKLGSGGGTAHLLLEAHKAMAPDMDFYGWLASEKRILLHAGGQGRRLPAYAPSGKILTPIPVFRWERGQRLSQNLLDIQVPLYQEIMAAAPDCLHTMIVSGDVFIRTTEPLQPIPEADVVCYGLCLGPEIAKDHGVFVAERTTPDMLKYMMQKPSVEILDALLKDHTYLTDIGIWLLSDKAVERLMQKASKEGTAQYYDLYSDFGRALGTHPEINDPLLADLSVAILPLPGGEFYHFGTSHELLSSMLDIQNLESDQRYIMPRDSQPLPSVFVQNAQVWIETKAENQNLWIENSCVSEQWSIESNHIITGVPENAWKIELRHGQCVDIVPIGDKAFAVRPYGYNDLFRGDLNDPSTEFIGQPFMQWAVERRIDINAIEGTDDLQRARIFPVVETLNDVQLVLRWMLNEPYQEGGRMLWYMSRRISAEEIADEANLLRLCEQRKEYRLFSWPFLAKNYKQSVFYQVDLEEAAHEFVEGNIALPHPIDIETPLLTRIHDAMFRSEVLRQKGGDGSEYDRQAFSLLREGLTAAAMRVKQHPHMMVPDEQMVCGQSPVRIDLAGGWTDTPPYCLMEGGDVINIAIDLNGQQPIRAYVKSCQQHQLVLRSIDLGAEEVVTTYEQLADYHHVGSPFSIPKAALALAGFLPEFSDTSYTSLDEQLQAFGGGIEVTLHSAIPAGSGMGTSSILAATVLGALNDFCGLSWDKYELGIRTLVLEQLLTTGGGWQDQYGGLLPGAKWLHTNPGFEQNPEVQWQPDTLFTQPEYSPCHLLYYTGITRTAKDILAEIVRRMFLNQHDELMLLRQMKQHAREMAETIQQCDFLQFGRLVRKTWMQNQSIDRGTNPPEVQKITELIDDLCLGYKLPGAGGGGFLYMVAKDPDAAARIKQILTTNPPNANACFVDMTLSDQGLQINRS